jgi:plastocyanin
LTLPRRFGSAIVLALIGVGSLLMAGCRGLAKVDGPNSGCRQETSAICMGGLSFRPDTKEVPVGATVTWINSSDEGHTVTFDPARAAKPKDAQLPEGVQPFASGFLRPGDTFAHTFAQPGTYKYFCQPHEGIGMTATIVVK